MLSDQAIKAGIREAKLGAKAIKRFDERGLFILLKPNGSALWRLKYYVGGREKLIGLGAYPDVTLKRAREKRDDARREVADGVDPSATRKAAKRADANSVEAVAKEWLDGQVSALDAGTLKRHRSRLQRFVFPHVGSSPIAKVTAADLLEILRRIEKSPRRNFSNRETAKRVRQLCGQIWRFGIATQRADRDISADLRGALAPPVAKNLPALTDPTRVGELLRAIHGYAGQPVTMAALKLAPLLFTRPGELRRMEWAELDLDKATWSIPGPKMKMKTPHIVPLSTQATVVLREIEPHTGGGKYVFPGLRSATRPMSENTVNGALRRLGFTGDEHVGHGFRTTASTMLNELGWNPDAIEAQLAHQDGNAIRRTYNKAKFLDERKRMMQAWADYLDQLRDGGNKVVPIRRSA
jgi:integrase